MTDARKRWYRDSGFMAAARARWPGMVALATGSPSGDVNPKARSHARMALFHRWKGYRLAKGQWGPEVPTVWRKEKPKGTE